MTIAADYDYDQLYPGRFIKAGEFKGCEYTLTISDIETEEMKSKKKGIETKVIVSFKGQKKQLVLNKTNGECLKGMFGRRVIEWIGRRVTFYPATVEAFGAPTLAIRVRGSPDLPADKDITCNLGQQGAVTVRMKKTGTSAKPANGSTGPQTAAPPTPPPAAPDPSTLPIGDANAEPPDEAFPD